MPEIINQSIGHWEHRYPNHKRLVGVWIQQHPDNPDVSYAGKHPCTVLYIFAHGRHHGFQYEPDGTLDGEGWSETPAWILDQLTIVYQPDTLKTLIRRAKANDRNAS